LFAKKYVDDLIYNDKGNEVVLIKYINPIAAPFSWLLRRRWTLAGDKPLEPLP
jgi:hypothetical protein